MALAPFPEVRVGHPHSDSAPGSTTAVSPSSASKMTLAEDPAFLSAFYVTTFFIDRKFSSSS